MAATEISIERLERALAVVAYAITIDGPVYAPIMERLEKEIAERRAGLDVVARARRHMDRLRDAVQVAPIDDDQAARLDARAGLKLIA